MTREELEELEDVRRIRTLIQRKPEYKEYGEFFISQLEHTPTPPNVYNSKHTREAMRFDLELKGARDQVQKAQTLFDTALNEFNSGPPVSDIGVTNRNVATSRLANALGIGDVVVQSELASLKDSSGESMSGILMQEAPGKSAQDALDDIYSEEALDTVDPANIFGTIKTKVRGTQRLFSPQFLHTLTNLQVLDSLIGQVDRHTGNYFVERTASGQFGAVHGIDNEMAFGLDTFAHVLYSSSEPNRMGNFGFNFFNSQGEIQLPYMDKQLADRIMALKREDLYLLLGDVLEEPYLDALWTRVWQAQEGIARDREEDPTGHRYLEREEQWDASVMAALVSPPSGEVVSYVGNLVAATEKADSRLPCAGVPSIQALADQYLAEEEGKLWVSLKDEKNRVERLKSLGSLDDHDIEFIRGSQDDFKYTAEETKDPEVQSILSKLTYCKQRAIERFAAEQKRRLAAKQKATS